MKMFTSFIHIIGLATVLLTSSCRDDQPAVSESTIDPERTLIVYLSRTKNTQAVAEMIQKNVGGTLVALELVTPYPEHYQTTVNQVGEENRTGYLPPLKTKIDNIGTYDYIFVGFPTWGMQLPPPIKSFLNEYDLSGKVIIPFNTHAGYGVGSGFRTIEELCPNSTLLGGYSTKGGVERDGILFVMEGEKEKQVQEDVKEWLREIALVK
jgi:flavodoxin